MECIFQLFTDHCKQLTDDDKLPEKATESLEAQMSQLKKVAAKRLILVVLDGGFQSDFLLLSDHRSFSRHVGRGARTPILMYRPCHCFEASGGTQDLCSFGFLCQCFCFQTTRIKGIMPKGLEVELELLGVKGIVRWCRHCHTS